MRLILLFESYHCLFLTIRGFLNGRFILWRFLSFICFTRIWRVLLWFFSFVRFIFGMLIPLSEPSQPKLTIISWWTIFPIFTALTHHLFHLSNSPQNQIIFLIFSYLVQVLHFFFLDLKSISQKIYNDPWIFAKIKKISPYLY